MGPPANIRESLNRIAQERILILDGAMGSMIQAHRTSSGEALAEDDFRGITGTRAQKERFWGHPLPLKGCNDLLCLTMPDLISGIHEDYLKAGADIIETCSFNSTPISLADYGLADLAYEISKTSAQLARKAADSYSTKNRQRFVAGSMGPTAKSATFSPDFDDPGKKAVTWDELEAAYYENARGLLDGGADIIAIETVFDTLNAKAAIFAVKRLEEERDIDVPLIISATVTEGGRLLSGQTVEAFCVSVMHADPIALGLNCSFGAEKLKPHLAAISSAVGCLVIAYPNAGLPNLQGEYEESPKLMAVHMEAYFQEGLVNIAGGCCGTTPAHITAIGAKAKKYPPRTVPDLPKKTLLAGLEVLEVSRARCLTEAGERTNVAGSRKFRKLIREKQYEDATGIARDMAEAGAMIIDVCMDDALLDAKTAITCFLNFSLQFPDLARIPMMIDSSNWEVIEAGLKCLQGKGLINSISLKDGETEFLRRARLARAYGAAIVVILSDEQGLAASYERKIAVASRSWELLKKINFPPEDIVFDPNVLAIATGIPEHDSYAMDFIRACGWIYINYPEVQISGGISNLSFSFRGNKTIRRALHAIFIKHAVEHGLSMAIVDPASLISYDEIDGELRQVIEELILNQTAASVADSGADSGVDSGAISGAISGSKKPIEKLLALAETYSKSRIGVAEITASKGIIGTISLEPDFQRKNAVWRRLTVEERITHAIVRGNEDFLAIDLEKLRYLYKRTLDIVEGPLMKGLQIVGDRFGEGRMFLPQVIRSARVMKRAISILEPYLKKEESGDDTGKARIILATVKGDVHDIGKNIAALVLGCNGYEIIDLGVMVPVEKIIERAKEEKADIIGLSGLIAPSLDEMMHAAQEMERQGFTIPLLIGGAAASLANTALQIAPEYSGPVVYISDAGQAPGAVRSLLSETERPGFLEKLKESYAAALKRHDSIRKNRNIISLEEARKNKVMLSWPAITENSGKKTNTGNALSLAEILEVPADSEDPEGNPTGNPTGIPAGNPAETPTENIITLNNYPLSRVVSHIDWTSFVQTWDLAVNTYPLAYNKVSREEEKKILNKLLDDANVLLEKIVQNNTLCLRGAVGLFPAYPEGDDIILVKETVRFCFPRDQERKTSGHPNPCLADFIAPRELYNQRHAESQTKKRNTDMAHNPDGKLGLFALSAGFGLREAQEEYRKQNDDYGALLLAGLANSLAEAFSDEVHCRLKKAWNGDSPKCGIRPAFGYPACPDHRDKEIVFRILGVQKRCALQLTESAMIIPAASVCGMYITHPDSFYFGIGMMGDDQLRDWVRRKGITFEEARKRLGGVIASR